MRLFWSDPIATHCRYSCLKTSMSGYLNNVFPYIILCVKQKYLLLVRCQLQLRSAKCRCMANLSVLIGNRLRVLRKERGLRQEDMEKFGISYKYYQRIEAGKVNVTLKTLEKIAKAFGVDPSDLLAVPLAKSPEINEMIASITDIIKTDDRKSAKKVSLFIKEFMA